MVRAPCKNCGHKLWSEVREFGSARILAHFDDDEGSDTYDEHAPDCPGCGARVDRGLPRANAALRRRFR